MFKSLHPGEFHAVLAIAAFFLTAAVFAVATWRALRIKPSDREHLANLPLDQRTSEQPTDSHSHGRTR